MFRKKDKLELYEVLKQHKIKVGEKIPPKEEPVLSSYSPLPRGGTRPTAVSATSATEPLTKPYPRFKIPFPTKSKQAVVSPSPSEKISRTKWDTAVAVSLPSRKPSGIEQKKPISLQTTFIILGILVVVGIIIYLIIFTPSPSESPKPATPAITPTTPPAKSIWSNRLVYYKDDAEGQQSSEKILRFLIEKGVSGVVTKKEKIHGVLHIVIYAGRYLSQDEAQKEHPKLKRLHYAFKNVQAVEVK
jgi:uncharacterized protein (UPF0333 family)